MDHFTFTFVSLAATVGSVLGIEVGYNKLCKQRKDRNDNEIDHASCGNKYHQTIRYANDFARTLGYLGMHSIYGMLIYPWMPLYLLGSTLRADLRGRFRS